MKYKYHMFCLICSSRFKKDMNIKGDLLRSRRGWVRRENRVGKVDGISSKYDFHIYIHIYEKIYEYISS